MPVVRLDMKEEAASRADPAEADMKLARDQPPPEGELPAAHPVVAQQEAVQPAVLRVCRPVPSRPASRQASAPALVAAQDAIV